MKKQHRVSKAATEDPAVGLGAMDFDLRWCRVVAPSVLRNWWSFFLVLIYLVFATDRASAQLDQAPESSSRRRPQGQTEVASAEMDDQVLVVRPNIILINLDDADSDLFSDELLKQHFPNMQRLASEGVRFTNCHVTTPLCGPSRTCLLRGQHAHRTGIKTNVARGPLNNGFSGAYGMFKDKGYESEHLGVWMQRAGYRTMMVGKYLHGTMDPAGIPGWDDLMMSFGGAYYGSASYSTRRPEDSRRRPIAPDQYRTVVEADEAVWMIEQQANRNRTRDQTTERQPFFLYIAPLAPHKPAAGKVMVENRFKDALPGVRMAETPDLNEADVSDKPAHLRVRKFSAKQMESLHGEFRKRLLTLLSFDEMLGKLLDALERESIDQQTYIFVTSDHGYQLGHSRQIAKKSPYHRSTLVPMFVHGPGIVAGRHQHLLTHLDLAPTFLELAQGDAPIELDGKSWVQLLQNPGRINATGFRESLLIQNWEEKNQFAKRIPATYASLRLFDKIYTEWANGAREFYDLSGDPYQLKNQIGSLSDAQRAKFSAQLHALKQGDTRPLATFSSSTLLGRKSTISGFAEDDQGVAKVQLELRAATGQQFWNGSQWQTEPIRLNAMLANPSGLISEWHYQLDLSAATVEGELSVRIFALDTEDRSSDVATATCQIDAVEPTTAMQWPADSSTVAPTQVLFYGTCDDDHGMQGIELQLQNIVSGKYWNGSSWVDKEATFFKRIARDKWHVRFDVPEGDYRVTARALDQAGNYDSTPAVSNFKVRQ